MKADKFLIEQLREEHIPITILGNVQKLHAKTGGLETLFKAWCCFYESDSDDLITGWGNHSGASSIPQINKNPIGRLEGIKVRSRTVEQEHQIRTQKQIDLGLRIIPGTWHINPCTGMLFNVDALSKKMLALLDVRDVGLNGFGEDSQFDSGVKRRATPDTSITDRLIDANPLANRWFLIQ